MSTRRTHRLSPEQMSARRVDLADKNPNSHSPGWPHFDRHGHCLCLNSCCFGPGGNRCKEGRTRP